MKALMFIGVILLSAVLKTAAILIGWNYIGVHLLGGANAMSFLQALGIVGCVALGSVSMTLKFK